MEDWLGEADEMELCQLTGAEYDHYVGLLVDNARELIDGTKLVSGWKEACRISEGRMTRSEAERDKLRALLRECVGWKGPHSVIDSDTDLGVRVRAELEDRP